MRTVYIYRRFCWCFFFQNLLLFIAIKCFYFIPVMRTAHFYTCLCSYCVLSFYFYCTLFIYSFFFLFEGLAWGSCTRVTFLTGLKQYIQSTLTFFLFPQGNTDWNVQTQPEVGYSRSYLARGDPVSWSSVLFVRQSPCASQKLIFETWFPAKLFYFCSFIGHVFPFDLKMQRANWDDWYHCHTCMINIELELS